MKVPTNMSGRYMVCLLTVLLPVLYAEGAVISNTGLKIQSLDSSPTSDVQDGGDGTPLKVDVANDSQPVIFSYRVNEMPSYQCQSVFWYLVNCDNENNIKQYWFYKQSGKYCVKEEGCYRLKCGSMLSPSFNLSGTEVQHADPVLISDTELKVEFHEMPSWALGWEIFVVDVNGSITGNVTALESHIAYVPGNYIVGEIYYLWYSPKLRENVEGRCSGRQGRRRNGNFTMTRTQSLP